MSGAKGKTKSASNPFELGREVMHSLGQNATKAAVNEAGESGKTFLEQLLGINIKKDSHNSEHAPVHADEKASSKPHHIEIFNSANHKNPSEKPRAYAEKAHSNAEAAIDYHGKFRKEIMQSRERASHSELNEMQSNIEQIKVELSKLVASSQELKLEFADVSVEQSATSVGQYHLSFFEWMLAVIRTAREKVEDSGAWLGTVKGKGAKKDYWGMFKKHGTTFGLSGERSVATSVG